MYSETCPIPRLSPLILYSGTFLAVCGAWMCTIFYKISLHAVAMGGLIAFFILFGDQDPFVSGLYLVHSHTDLRGMSFAHPV